MVIVDANVLIYAVDETGERQADCQAWLDEALGGAETVGFSWAVLLAFMRITTNRAIMPNPLSPEEAIDQVDFWLEAPAAVVVDPGQRHSQNLRGLLREVGTAGNLTTDAHLAALAIESSAAVVSFDRGFGRFESVKHRLPEPPG